MIPLNKPRVIAFQKASAEKDVSEITVEWVYEGNPSHPLPTSFEVRIGNDRQFVTGGIFTSPGSTARKITLPTNITLWESELSTYLQVRTVYNNPQTETKSTSEWSAVTDPWLTADKCRNKEEYLNVHPKKLSDWECLDCPEGSYCTGSTVWDDILPLLGYWRVPWSSNGIQNGTEFVKCPFMNDCLGVRVDEEGKSGESKKINNNNNNNNGNYSNTTIIEGCIEGTSGVVCSTCLTNYNRDGQKCIQCSNTDFTIRLIVFVLIIVLLLVLGVMFRKRLKKKWKKYQPLYRDVLRIASINVTFAQINSSLPSVIEVEWPLNFIKFLDYFSFVNIDIMSLIGINCVGQFNFVLSFSIMTLLPISIVLLAIIEYCYVSKTLHSRFNNMSDIKKKEKEKEALHLLFSMADSDHSGVIDPAELAGILRELGWNVNVRIAMDLSEKIGAIEDERGTYFMNEIQFVNAMTSGKMMKLLSKLQIKRRGRSMMMMKSRSGKHVVPKPQEEKEGQLGLEGQEEKSIQKKQDQINKKSTLGSRNKLVMWTLRRLELSTTLRGATQLLLLAHTPVSRKVFQYFHFQSVGGRLFVRADFSLVAWSEEYIQFLPYVVAVMFFFTAALPAVISFYLWRHRKELYTTSVYQTIGWLYDAFLRGAEFWQVHDVLMKMILTGMLIYVPNSARAAIASLLCTLACCNLNFFRPHKNKVLFWLTQISFLVTTFKYITAMILSSSKSDKSASSVELIGYLLIFLDFIFMIASFIAIPMALFALRMKVNAGHKAETKVALSKVTPVSEEDEERRKLELREWQVTDLNRVKSKNYD